MRMTVLASLTGQYETTVHEKWKKVILIPMHAINNFNWCKTYNVSVTEFDLSCKKGWKCLKIIKSCLTILLRK